MTGDRFYFHRVTAAEKFLRSVDHLRIDLYKGGGELGARVEMTGDVVADDVDEVTDTIRSMIDEFTAGE